MATILVPVDELKELAEGGDSVVRDRIIAHRRWSVVHELIFGRGDKLYRVEYSVGATESQDERPFDYSKDPVECVEVREVPAVDYAPVDGGEEST